MYENYQDIPVYGYKSSRLSSDEMNGDEKVGESKFEQRKGGVKKVKKKKKS